MSRPFLGLTPDALRAVADGLRSGRLSLPLSAVALKRYVPDGKAKALAVDLQRLLSAGPSGAVASLLEILADERASTGETPTELVCSGPTIRAAESRDTAVVIREMFEAAERSVLLAGFAVTHGKRIFEALGRRMAERPDLDVTFCLDVSRREGNDHPESEVVEDFARRFRTQHWPKDTRLPKVFYDPRALISAQRDRAILHAKCLAVDGVELFVTSANFTDAAQRKNIEVGVRLKDPVLAATLQKFFAGLIESRQLATLDWDRP